jgi:hypothetical protein
LVDECRLERIERTAELSQRSQRSERRAQPHELVVGIEFSAP